MATTNAPRTVKDVPAQEFVVALAQYFRSTGKVRVVACASRARSPVVSARVGVGREHRSRSCERLSRSRMICMRMNTFMSSSHPSSFAVRGCSKRAHVFTHAAVLGLAIRDAGSIGFNVVRRSTSRARFETENVLRLVVIHAFTASTARDVPHGRTRAVDVLLNLPRAWLA